MPSLLCPPLPEAKATVRRPLNNLTDENALRSYCVLQYVPFIPHHFRIRNSLFKLTIRTTFRSGTLHCVPPNRFWPHRGILERVLSIPLHVPLLSGVFMVVDECTRTDIFGKLAAGVSIATWIWLGVLYVHPFFVTPTPKKKRLTYVMLNFGNRIRYNRLPVSTHPLTRSSAHVISFLVLVPIWIGSSVLLLPPLPPVCPLLPSLTHLPHPLSSSVYL